MAIAYFSLDAYAPNGAKLGSLPDAMDLKITSALNDHGSLSFTYPRDGVNASCLNPWIPVELWLYTRTTGYDVYNGRYIALRRSIDPAQSSGFITVECVTRSWLLTKLLVGFNSPIASDGTVTYSVNASAILTDLIGQRPTATGRGLDIGGSLSRGGTWSTPTISFDCGATVDSALTTLTSAGMVEWIPSRDTLNSIWVAPQSSDSGLAVTQNVFLTFGEDIIEGEASWDTSTLVDAAYAFKASSTSRVAYGAAAGSSTGWGRFEASVSVPNGTTAALTPAAQALRSSPIQPSYKYSVVLNETTSVPIVQYYPGNFITVPNYAGSPTSMRIMELAVTVNDQGVPERADIVLNQRSVDSRVRQARRLQAVSGGFSNITTIK